MSKLQTENSHFEAKVQLRINHLPDGETLRVLDAFSADGKIWDEIKRRTGRRILVLRIEAKADKAGIYLKGDNTKYMARMDLKKYDIIDLDAFRIPYEQLQIIFRQDYTGIVFATMIQSMMGQLPQDMLKSIGYTKSMVKKCPSLFNRYGWKRITQYLASHNVKTIHRVSFERKNYICFTRTNE